MISSPTRGAVYLDHNAGAPLSTAASQAMARALEMAGGSWGNPSSPHAFGHRARLALEDARRDVASLIGARASEIVFVSGGTEADNLAIRGAAAAIETAGGTQGLRHLVTTAVEHPAVLEPCRHLASRGWRLTVLPVDAHGCVQTVAMEKAFAQEPALISVMAANNETGTLQPLGQIARLARQTAAVLHVDAAQAAGRIRLDVRELDVDLVSISSHKIGGPAGIGALYVREGTPLEPLILGGGQEGRRRAGTELPALAAGFAAAAKDASSRLANEAVRLADLRNKMERRLAGLIAGIRFNGSGGSAGRLPSTSSMMIPGIAHESLVIAMDLRGFAISTGSACSTGSSRPSHVLAAMGMSADEAASTVRVSFGASTRQDELDAFVQTLAEVAADLTAGGSAKGAAPPVGVAGGSL